MNDFRQRLEKAIQRGQRVRHAQARAEAERALTEQELKSLHSRYRLELVERIEAALKQLCDHFRSGDRNYYSRLEMVIRPFTSYHVLELAGKATIHNRELFNRSQFQELPDVDLSTFTELIDNWSLEFAERYAAQG